MRGVIDAIAPPADPVDPISEFAVRTTPTLDPDREIYLKPDLLQVD